MATASVPQFKAPTPSSSRSNINPEYRRLQLQAEKLISFDPTHILDLLANLHPSAGEPSEGRRKEAKKVLEVALKEYPTSTAITLIVHLQNNTNRSTRSRCAKLLCRLFRPQDNLYSRISHFYHSRIKAALLQCLGKETHPAFENVIGVVFNIAEVLLPKKEWRELYDFIFESLKSDVSRKEMIALLLLAELIRRCPPVFLFRIDALSEVFKDFMDSKREHNVFGVAAVEAAVALVLHLATPSNHGKYYDLLVYMARSLLGAVNEQDYGVAEGIINGMTTLAQAETRFLKPHIDVLVKTMLDVAETNVDADEKMAQCAIEFVVKVAEDVEYGCGMIQNISPELRKRLFAILLKMISTMEEDPLWEMYDVDDSDNEDEPSRTERCSYAMEAIPRLVTALRENVTIQSLPDCFAQFLEDISWQRRHAAITALGLIADGCPKSCSGISETYRKIIRNLCVDGHTYVRWATIQAIGRFSKNWGPRCQGEMFSIFLPALINFMEDFDNPRTQLAAVSTILLFSKTCSSEIISPFLKSIVNSLCSFLEMILYEKEALAALASLIDTFPKELEEHYDAILGHVKVFLAGRHEKENSMLAAKALECMTAIAVATRKNRFMTNVDKVIETLNRFGECRLDSDDPMRHHILQTWGRLGKCLGTDFVPYLSVCMQQLLDSAYLPDDHNSRKNADDERSNVKEERATACEVLCSFATEFTEDIHMWMDEILFCFIPLLTFKHDARVRTHAISAMPLMLRSASRALDKLLPFGKSLKEISDTIIPALVNALCKEMESGIRLKILEALNKCIEIIGSRLGESVINQFIKVITDVLSTYSNMKTERKRRVERGLDNREKALLQEEIEIENNIYRAIADCLISIINIFRTSFLPMLDKLLPCLVLHWNTNSTEQRVFLRIARSVAEKCGEDAFKHYEKRLLAMLESCDLDNPRVWQLVGYGISICAEFGGNVFKRHREAALCALQHILSLPRSLHLHNLIKREIAVFALGKMCKFHFNGPNAHMGVKIWLTYLPLRNNLVEAKQMHDDLCTMLERSEKKVLGPCPQYSDYKIIIEIIGWILWSGSMLATDDTLNRMKDILRKFKERMLSCDFESICSSFPFPVQTALNSCL